MQTDCLLVGFNNSDFPEYVDLVRSMGEDSGAFRDLNLAFIDIDGRPHHALDVMNHFLQGPSRDPSQDLNNTDFLWPTLTYLGSYLARRGFTYDYVNLFQREKEAFRRKLLAGDVLTVAITTTLYVTPHPIQEIISFIRAHNGDVRIVVGGPYIANQARMADGAEQQRIFRSLDADFYVISQEGELALTRLLAALKGDGALSAVENIAYREGDGYRVTPSSVEQNPLDRNRVDYSLFPPGDLGEFVSLRTAKSCPFACSFCGFPERAGRYRYLDVDMVEEELDALADVGTVTTVTFLDDTFNVPRKRFRRILEMMIARRFPFKWNCFYRCDHGDDEIIELMGRAGCEGVFLGVESGSDEMLQRMNKTARREHYLRAVPRLREAGISTYASLIIGFPGETLETVEETIDLIETAAPDFYRAQLWYCDPITPIWKRREELSIQGSAFAWSHYTMDHRTACALIDRMFLRVRNSTWLPQNGFEQWSTFYLQRKGMSLGRIKGFLDNFNAAVKRKLLFPGPRPVEPELLSAVAASCRPTDPGAPAAGSQAAGPALYPASAYAAAESFWLGALDPLPGPALEPATSGGPAEGRDRRGAAWARTSVPLPAPARRWFGGSDAALLAAAGVLLSRLSGEDESLVLHLAAGREAAPLRLRSVWGASFADHEAGAAADLAAVDPHRPFAYHVLSGPLARERLGRVPGAAEMACCGVEGPAAADGRGIEEALAGLGDGVTLVAAPRVEEGSAGLTLHYRGDAWTAGAAAEVGRHLAALLAAAAERPGEPIENLVGGAEAGPGDGAILPEGIADEAFVF